MNKINVLQLMTDSKIGGAERVVLSLAKGLDKERFNVIVCCLANRGPIFEEIEKEGIKVYSLGIGSKWGLFKSLRLLTLLDKESIHILHSHLFHANILARILGKLRRVPIVICSEHIMGMEGKWRLFLNKLTSGLVDKFITVSFAVKDFLVKYIGIECSKIEVVQNGIDYDEAVTSIADNENIRSEFGFLKADKIIGTVARIHKQKGHVYLLRAACEVVKNFPEAKFLIVGDGPLKNSMERLSSQLNIAENMVFTGFKKNIPEVLSILDIFVLPSLWEGLPITILEAMSMKKPVIATRVSGNIEVVENNVTGILVPPRDSSFLARAIIELLNDEELRKKMGEIGYQKGKQIFNAKRMISETVSIYERLIREKNVKGC